MERERARERDEERKKKMTCGARVLVTGEMKYTSSYTPIAGPRLCPYIFSGIFVETKNFNGILQNRCIVMVFMQTSKIIIA